MCSDGRKNSIKSGKFFPQGSHISFFIYLLLLSLMSKRLLTFDFLRGFAIICIAMFHLLLLTCDLVTQATNDPFSLPLFYLIITVLTVVLAHWRGLFLIISSVVHIFTMTNAIRNGADRKKLWLSQIKFGLILWVFGMFREVFLNEWSLPMLLAQGATFTEALTERWAWIYLMEALEDVAWGIIFTSTIFYFLTANNGVEKITRNAIIFLLLSAGVIFLSPVINQLATAFYGQDPANTSPESIQFLGWWDYPTRLFIGLFITYNSPLFPMLGYTFAGVVLGLLLTRPVIPKTFLRNTALFCLGLIVLGVIWLLFIDGIPSDIGRLINFQFHPTWYMFLAIGMQTLVLLILLRLIEFNPNVNLERALKWTKMGRRWGVTALTVYSFFALQYLVRFFLGLIFTQYDWLQNNTLPFAWTVGLIIIMITVWNVLLKLWEHAKFKYSLEWLLTKLGKRNKPGKKINQVDVLDVEGVLHHPEPILFVQPRTEQKIPFTVFAQK
jgi:hypothetical protein